MGKHSNKKIEKHVEDSETLIEKMQKLAETLKTALQKNFEDTMGCALPTIVFAKVRETDVAMFYSSDPSVDEYINGARKVLNAAFGGDKTAITNGMLDIVEVVVSKIIGTGDIKTGIHSTSVNMGDYITAAFSAVQKATAKDWAMETDFFVSYYAFVIFKPSLTQKVMLAKSPMLMAVGPKQAVDIKSLAAKHYACKPF
jgi:hypothetical protein